MQERFRDCTRCIVPLDFLDVCWLEVCVLKVEAMLSMGMSGWCNLLA